MNLYLSYVCFNIILFSQKGYVYMMAIIHSFSGFTLENYLIKINMLFALLGIQPKGLLCVLMNLYI